MALGLISGLYALICVPMRLVDYARLMALLMGALLMGAMASFAAVVCVIYFTRRIWCGGRQQESEA